VGGTLTVICRREMNITAVTLAGLLRDTRRDIGTHFTVKILSPV
jgi:hypothetical protein